MANQRDYAEYFGHDSQHELAIRSGRSRCRPLEVIAGILYIDCTLWQNASPTDVVLMHPDQALKLLQSSETAIIDPGLHHMFERWLRADLRSSARQTEIMMMQMSSEPFAVYFTDHSHVPNNLRGETLNLQVMAPKFIAHNNATRDSITTARRDGPIPITRHTPTTV